MAAAAGAVAVPKTTLGSSKMAPYNTGPWDARAVGCLKHSFEVLAYIRHTVDLEDF